MVKGVEIFQSYFKGFEDQYAVIGGAACELLFGEVGLGFRATKDIDMVICVELVSAEFGGRFREFIEDGRYHVRQKCDGKKEYHRFLKPEDGRFPDMLELFTRAPEGLALPEDMKITKIPIEEDVISLSAILLDDDYYAALLGARKPVDGVTILDETLLIPFKARAFLDLRERKKKGESVDANNIKKHRNDVARLAQLLAEGQKIDVSQTIANDVAQYLSIVEQDETFDPKSFGVQLSRQDVCAMLKTAYGASLTE